MVLAGWDIDLENGQYVDTRFKDKDTGKTKVLGYDSPDFFQLQMTTNGEKSKPQLESLSSVAKKWMVSAVTFGLKLNLIRPIGMTWWFSSMMVVEEKSNNSRMWVTGITVPRNILFRLYQSLA